MAQCDILGAGHVATERLKTDRRVAVAAGAAKQCSIAVGRVEVAIDIATECLKTGGRVAATSGVAKKRLITVGRVLDAEPTAGVRKQGEGSGSRILPAVGVTSKRSSAGSRIFKSCGIRKERLKTNGGV